MKKIKIGKWAIENYGKPFIIGEAGINHNGIIENALRMVDVAKKNKLNAIKFQTFKANEFIMDNNLKFSYFSQGKKITEPMIELFKRCEFRKKEWIELKKYCDEKNILFLSTPQNQSDLKLLLSLEVEAIKIGSDDLTNLPLLQNYSKSKLPIIISCGMANFYEINEALTTIGTLKGYPTILLVTTSQYPTPDKDVNLKRIKTLKNKFPKLPIGFSDHTKDNFSAIMATSLGCCVFEKHFTLDNNLNGPDHWFSLNPNKLKIWSDSIKTSYKMIGNEEVKPTNSEIMMKSIARRSIVAINDIDEGDIFDKNNIGLRRPGTGIQPIMFESILGKKSLKKIKKFSMLTKEDFK